MRPRSLAACLTLVGQAVFAQQGPDASVLSIDTPSGAVPTRIVHPADRSPRASADNRPALVIGLHGFGIDETQVATLMQLELSFDHTYLAPRGFFTLDDGTHGWFPIGVDDQGVAIDMRDAIAAMDRLAEYIHAAVEATGADPGRVYVVGYSQGGAMAIAMARRHPQVASAYVGLAGGVLPRVPPADDAPANASATLFIGHGTVERFTTAEQMSSHAQSIRDDGHDVTYRTYVVPHVVSGAMRRDVSAWLNALEAQPAESP
ncbi:MAG: alpha/beta fold hydrolase [Planctomycetota bacterium]